jgi:hypothetical protein
MLRKFFVLFGILYFNLTFGQEHSCIINDNDFEGIKSAILNITSEEERVNTGIEIIIKTNCCFYSKHIYQIAQSLSVTSNRINFIKGVYNNILDVQSHDFNKLLSLFSSDNDKNYINSFIDSNKSGCLFNEKQHQKHAGSKKKNKIIDNIPNKDTTVRTDVSKNAKITGSPPDEGKRYIEWIEPVKNIKTVHGYNRVKAKVYCNSVPEIVLMVDNIIIQTKPVNIIPFENKGFIYSYYVGLHEGDNHVLIRLLNPSDSTFIYSKDLIINYQPQ